MGTKKKRDFTKIPKENILRNEGFGQGSLPTHATTFQEVGILLTLVYFHLEGLILERMLCIDPKGLFSYFMGCLKSFYGLFPANFVECLWQAQSMVLRVFWLYF